MPQVNIPNVGMVNFPDTMSREDISTAIRTKILPRYQATKPAGAGAMAPTPAPAPGVQTPEMRRQMERRLQEDLYPTPQLKESHPSVLQKALGYLSRQPYGSTLYNIGATAQQVPRLFEPGEKHPFEEPTEAPKTKTEALGQIGKSLANLATAPATPLMLMTGSIGENPAALSLLHKALGLAFAPMAGEQVGLGAEQLTRPGATAPERITGAGQAGLGALMSLGSVAPFIPKAPVIPEHLKPMPGRPLTVEEINARAGLTKQTPPKRVFTGTPAETPETSPFGKGKMMAVPKVEEVTPSEVGKVTEPPKEPQPSPTTAPAAEVPAKETPPGAAQPPAAPAKVAPFSVKPAVRVGGKVHTQEGEFVGHAGLKQTVQIRLAKQTGKVPRPQELEGGWVDQAGNFYKTPMEVARAKMQHEQAGGQHAVQERSPETVPMGTPPRGGGKVEPRTSKTKETPYVLQQQPGSREAEPIIQEGTQAVPRPPVEEQRQVETPPAAQGTLPQEGVQPVGGGGGDAKHEQSNARRIVPAVREGGKVTVGKQGETHNEIVKRGGHGKFQERGFVLDGKFITREEAAEATGLKTSEPGRLHSEDLPGYKEKTKAKPTGESGFVDVGAVTDALKDIYGEKVAPVLQGFKDAWTRQALRRSGESLPFHAKQNKDLGNAAYMVGQAPAIANRLAEVDPKIVMNGEKVDSEFDHKLGAVWTEAQLRDKRSQLLEQGQDASAVQSLIGKGVIADEAEYQALLRDPRIQEATQEMRRLIQNPARERHIALGGKLAREPGIGFVNLLVKKEPKLPTTAGLRGAQLKKTAFGAQRTGTGTGYDTSATRIMQNMIQGNYYRDALAKYYKAAEAKGVGKWVKAGEEPPAGHSAIPQDVTRLIIKEEGEPIQTKTIRKDFYLRDDLMPEFRRITNLDKGAVNMAEHRLGDFLTKIQVEAGVDALGHTGNIVAAVNSAARPELGKNLFGAREVSTLTDITKIIGQQVAESPEFLRLAHEMAEQGIVRQHGTMEGLFGKRSLGARAISAVDTAGRTLLYKMAQEAAKKGLGTKDPVLIRRQIDKQLGQYNPRLMTAFQHMMRSTFSPFSVASRTFNSLATQRLLMSPGFAAANRTAWVKLAARQMAYATTAYFAAPMLLNYQQTGEAMPEGVKFGEGIIGRNEDGSYKTFDFLKLNFLRRGLRVTGAGKVIEQQVVPRMKGEQPAAIGQTAREATMEVIKGKIAPYTTGPIIRIPYALMTGKSPEQYELRKPGEKQAPYIGAAVRALNPVTGALMEGEASGEGTKPLVQRFAKMVGVQSSSKPEQVIGNLRRQFLYKIGKVKQADFTPSEYIPMVNALKEGDVEKAKEEYGKLYEIQKREHAFSSNPDEETRKQFQQYFDKYAKGHGNASKEDEEKFVRSLTPHQQELYKEVQAANQKVADLFFNNLQAKKPSKKGFGFSSLKF